MDVSRAQTPVYNSASAQVDPVVTVRKGTSAQAQHTPSTAPRSMFAVQLAAENALIEEELQRE